MLRGQSIRPRHGSPRSVGAVLALVRRLDRDGGRGGDDFGLARLASGQNGDGDEGKRDFLRHGLLLYKGFECPFLSIVDARDARTR